MKRLTSVRMANVHPGGRYWSALKKDMLVQRLGEYEDLGVSPKEAKLSCLNKEEVSHIKDLLVDALDEAIRDNDRPTVRRTNEIFRKLGWYELAKSPQWN